jgi:hypothetical protein
MFPEFLYCARSGIEIVHSMRRNPHQRPVRAPLRSLSMCIDEQKMAHGAHKAQPFAGL